MREPNHPDEPAANGAPPFTCPTCWSVFELQDVLAIAHHDKLRGDDVLGENAMQRFLPDRFDYNGRPLDSMGCACPDKACPRCRRKLHAGFFNQPSHIFSLVGEQSSGKSYYLAVLTKTLPAALFKHFQVRFMDADPTGNIALNDLRNKLFTAETPQEAVLAKTQLSSEMYELIQLKDWPEPLRFPKPFVYTVAQNGKANASGFSLVFYDNAGEHFRPDIDIVRFPGASHVAKASGILFLFDPFHSPAFRKRMQNTNADPQLGRPAIDQQGVLLATMSNRIKTIRGMSINEQVETPLAVIVGKSDAWQHFIGENPWSEPIDNGTLNLTTIHRNSNVVRQLLMDLCPEIVVGAESNSHNVLYFPASSFGHSPVSVKDSRGQEMIAPNPSQLKPLMTEIPALWLLSQISGTRAFVPLCASTPEETFRADDVLGPLQHTLHIPLLSTPEETFRADDVRQPFDFKAPCTPMVGDLNKLICAYLTAADGYLSEAEQEWLAENLGPESIGVILNLAEDLNYEALPDQIARMTSTLVLEEQEWLRDAQPFWSQLAHCDGAADTDLKALKWISCQVDAAIRAAI